MLMMDENAQQQALLAFVSLAKYGELAKTAQQLNRLIDRQFFPDQYTRLEEKRKILKCIDELNSQPRNNAA